MGFPSWDRAPSPPPLSLFSSFIFFLPVFEDNDLLFWVPDVLCQHSEVVLWSLLSVEMFFWGICEGESGLPILFLCHLPLHPWNTLWKEWLSKIMMKMPTFEEFELWVNRWLFINFYIWCLIFFIIIENQIIVSKHMPKFLKFFILSFLYVEKIYWWNAPLQENLV